MKPVTIGPNDVLEGDIDVEALARKFPESYVVKGMFFGRFVRLLGADFERVQRTLAAPPRLGHHIAFSDYPQADFMRISAAVARKAYPRVGLREGLRRVARDDFGVFADSTFGRVLLTVVGDAKAALRKVPALYKRVASGDYRIVATDLDASTVRLEFEPVYGVWEYQVGQIEGLSRFYESSCTVTASKHHPHHVRFDVRVTP